MVDKQQTEVIFPRDARKTYGLMELVRGTSPMVSKGPDDTVFAFPVVALLELLLLLGTTFVVFFLSLVRNAPLEEIANPNVTTNPAKAPWYFIGLQELLEHMHPTLAGVIIPGVLVLFLLALPYLDTGPVAPGWFSGPRGRRITLFSGLYALIAMPSLILLDTIINPHETLRTVVPPLLTQYIIPTLVLAVVVIVPWLVLRRLRTTPREVLIGLFTIMLVAAFVFTVSGFFFRGPGFRLYWPWAMPNGYNPLDTL